MIARICPALLLLLVSSTFLAANAAGTTGADQRSVWVDPGWRQTVSRYKVTFDEQGLSTTVFDFEIQALDEKGAEAISQQTVAYNGYFNELTADNLATLKADGSVIAVDARAIRDQPASANTASPYFDEQRRRLIAYSNVVPGDKIRGRLIYKTKRAVFAGEFADYWSQLADQPPELIEITLDGPASKPLHIAGRNVEHSEERSGNRIIHHVRMRQETPKPRQMEIDSFDDARRFEVSTFADYAAFAAMLNARNAPMAVPDQKLSKLSTEIVGDATEPRRKVELIHNWVARNIRYVGIGFQDGGWTSQPASAVLASRYGDCKAHATILKALLAAQGIEANLVAVNADAQYTLTEVATANFNHAIVYVPQIDQYLDPTASLLAFGALPPNLDGKPALNIDKGTLASIPVAKPESFAFATDTDYTLAGDGTRRARSILSGTGLGALTGRVVAQGLERVDRPSVAKKLIEYANLTGSGDYSFPSPRELSDSYAITATFQISKPVERHQTARTKMLPLTDPRPSLSDLTAGGANGQPFPCHSFEYRETSSLTLPQGTNFHEKPAPVTYAAGFNGRTAFGPASGRIEVSGAAVLDGRTMRSSALVRLTFDAAVCPAEFAAAIKTGLEKFTEFKYGMIGLTPRSAPYVTEISADLDEGEKAFHAGNYKLAIARLKPLAERGGARAQYYLGDMYDGGFGAKQDYREAIRWYQMSAEQGDADSQSHLGYLYENGLGAARDEKLAVQWYAKAADQDDAWSQARLASMYRDGRGLAQDFQQAAKWFAKAADQGSTWAQMNLGLLYIKGQGVPLDYTKAMFWLRNAADRNDNYAQYNLGWVYESGKGVPKDTKQAIEWYSKAADAGNQEASARLAGLTGGNSFWGVLFKLHHLALRAWQVALPLPSDVIAQIREWLWPASSPE
jgi:TPR repeat protein/transglutaminase-like putative cysteine protease